MFQGRKAISWSRELEKLQRSEHEGKWKEELDHTGSPGLSVVVLSPIPATLLQQGTAPIALQ